MKRMLVVLLVTVFALGAVLPVGAQGGEYGNGTGGDSGQVRNGWFTMTGTVVGINTQTRTMTMLVLRTNSLAQAMIGQQVQIRLTTQTQYRYNAISQGRIQTQASTRSALRIGQPVNVQGMFANRVWTSSRLTIGASLGVLP